MADEALINRENSDDQTVKITGDEASSEILGLTKKITDLERENGETIKENEGYKQQIEELRASIEELGTENEELKKKVDKRELDNKTLALAAVQAAQLDGELSRLQKEVANAISDLQDSNVELSDLKRDLEGVKKREKEKDVKLEAIGKEKDLLLFKIKKLEGVGSSLRYDSEGKEKEIQSLKKERKELLVALEYSMNLEKLKNVLENMIEKMKRDICILRLSIQEKEERIDRIAVKELKATEASVKREIEGFGGNVKQIGWMVVGALIFGGAAMMGFTYHMPAAKKR